MKTFLTLIAVGGVMSSAMWAADMEAMSPAKAFDSDLKGVEQEMVALAEAMPADKYSFAPKDGAFKGVRTFAQQMTHVATVNYSVAAALLGEKTPVDMGKDENGAASLNSKEAIVKYLKDSFAYTHKAMQTATSANLMEMIQGPFGNRKTSRMSLYTIPAWHSFDHYGQSVVYARMNGVVPPPPSR